MTSADHSTGADAKRVLVNLLTPATQGLTTLFYLQMTHLLGPDRFGTYSFSRTIIDLFSMFTLFGMDQATMKHASLALAQADRDAMARSTANALRVVFLSGIAASALVFLGAPAVHAANPAHREIVPVLRALSLYPVWYHLSTILVTATQAKGTMKWNFWVRGVAQPVLLLAFTTLALRTGASLPWVAFAVTAAFAVVTVLSAWAYGRELPLGLTLHLAIHSPVDRGVLRSGFGLMVASMAWVLVGRAESFGIGWFGSPGDAGRMSACMLLVVVIGQMRGAFEPVVCRAIPGHVARREFEPLNVIMKRHTRWVTMVTTPLLVLFVAFGAPVVAVFGKGYAAGAIPLGVLALAQFIAAISLTPYALTMGGKPKLSSYAAFVALGTQALLLPLLIHFWGLLGAAISAAAAMFMAQVYQQWMAYKHFRLNGFSWPLLGILALGAGAGGVGVGLMAVVPGNLASRFFVAMPAAAVVYAGLLWLMGLDEEERTLVRGRLAKLQTRLRQAF